MKRITLLLTLLTLVLTACATPPLDEPRPVSIQTDLPPLHATETPVAASKIPAASFESQTYFDETVGFALDYPAGWTIHQAVIGSRGSQVQLLSSPDLVDMASLPEGATRVSVTVYQWDPKNDLAAYVANRKTAWEASGFAVTEEQSVTLDLGLPAMLFTVQTPDSNAIFLFAAIGDQYLEISGEGNLELVKEIALRLRPISVK